MALYSEVLLDHFRHPRNYGSLAEPHVAYEDFNPLCGDRIRIELKFKDRIIEEVRFKGDGCAIAIAAASMLTELILGADIQEVRELSYEKLIMSLKSEIRPSRIQCARLPLEALRACLREYQGSV